MRLLLERQFALLFWGRLISRLGDAIFQIGIMWFALELTGSATTVASLGALMVGTSIVMGPIGGAFADQHKKVNLMVLSDGIRGIICLALAIIVFANHDPKLVMIGLYVLGFCMALCQSVFEPASKAIIPLVVSKSSFMQANSLLSITGSMTSIIGLAFGAVIYGVAGAVGILIIDGVSYILSAFSEVFIQVIEVSKPKNAQENPVVKQWAMIREGLDYLKQQKPLIMLTLIATFVNLCFAPLLQVYIPYLIQDTLHANIVYLSALNMACSIGMVLAAVLISIFPMRSKVIRTLKRATILLTGLTILSTISVFLIFGNQVSFPIFLAVFMTIMFSIGMVITLVNVPMETYLQQTVEHRLLGRVSSVLSTASMAAMPIGLLVGGAIIDMLDVRYAYGTSAVLLVVICIVMMTFPSFKDVKDLKTTLSPS